MEAQASTARRHWLGLAAAVAILLAVGAGVVLDARRFAHDADWVDRTHATLERLALLYSRVKDAESAQRGYLLTGAVDYLGQFHAARGEIADQERALLAGLDDGAQRRRAGELMQLIELRLQHNDRVIGIYGRDGLAAAQAEVATHIGRDLMQRIAELTRAIEDEQRRLLEERRSASDASADWMQATTALGIGLSLALLAAVFGLMLREVRIRREAERRSSEAGDALHASVAELTRAGSRLRELSHYAGMLQSCRDAEEAMRITRESFLRLLPEVGGAVLLMRASQNLLEEQARWGTLAADTAALLPPMDCWALRRGQPHAAEDVARSGRCTHVVAPASGEAGTLCVPIAAQGQTIGLLYCSAPPAPLRAVQELAIAAAEQLSLALSNLRLQESLHHQSIRDPLTGLYNRRYLEESFDRELARCSRRRLPLAVMMLDVDHFKRFNDSHGHDGGDALLTQFARLLQAHCRGDDIACRYGGEEFTLLLPEMSLEAALERAETIRAATEAMRMQHRREPLTPVTVSIGLAAYPRHGGSAEDLLRSADAALYRAKHAGRNRVAVAEH